MRSCSALAIGLLLLSAACIRSTTESLQAARYPDETVRNFLSLSAGAKSGEDRKRLEGMCYGKMRDAFAQMSDDVFRLSYLGGSIKILDIKVVETSTKEDVAKVRYQVSVENRQGTDPTRETNEREVELARNQGLWYIASIKAQGTDKIAFTNGMIF